MKKYLITPVKPCLWKRFAITTDETKEELKEMFMKGTKIRNILK